MYKLDNNEIEDETNNSVSLTSLLEFLDPIASKVVSKYYHGSNLSKAEQKLRNFEGFRRRKPHHDHDSHHPHHLNRSRSILQLEDFKLRALQRIKNLDKPLDSIFFKNSSRLEKAFYPFTLFTSFHWGPDG
ncbi:YGR149W-like protein [Saccharomyces kudriavzevii IFO 1802]|uniref:YGR149W-like protein n=1 Tax=Saccharomyces kudriavzevii (strain ATCC MYA-4449 / AS 2.2408 / CBS 8840 / NBRC 1802 / NCYC 2889) TaxID=226230 RepID=J5S0Z1_SACK1|nr:YGR149W-like protein [Saccharomyces kudriavzevii IFO 1802]